MAYCSQKNLVIIGAGDFGREVFTWASQAITHGAPWRIKGFLDARKGKLDGFDGYAPILGNSQTYDIDDGDVFIGASGDPKDKLKFYLPIIDKGGHFVNVIHPLASIGKNVQLGTGIVMAPFSCLSCDIKVGNHVAIGAFSSAGHDNVIGDWSQVCGHCSINGGVTLGEKVFLGDHACIIPQITVGDWAYVGAGSVVLRNVEPEHKVFGNPAKVIGRVERI
jgi:sugar O-acyltransferase (sialic acid O-acetyltransferase NeuD family)